jgi:hypothetical protein
MTNEESVIETMVPAKGKTAPRIRPQDLDDAIDKEATQYHHFPGTRTTVCCIRVRNDFYVVGESSAVSDENFDEEIGREVAFKDARDKLWMLLGFALKERLAGSMADER